MTRGSLPGLSELPDSWDPIPMNIENYRAVTPLSPVAPPLPSGG